MKKLNLCILSLFLFSAFLFGVESEPSEIVGYVAYDCVTTASGNNNFIALPMDTGYANTVELGNAYLGQINAISKWIPSSQGWSTSFWDGTTWNDPFALDLANAYMISVTEGITFYSVGPMVSPIQYNLITSPTGNNNFIMVPLDRSDLTTSPSLGDDIGTANAVSRWVADSQGWGTTFYDGTIWNDPFTISIAKPLMVSVTADVVWPSTRLETRN